MSTLALRASPLEHNAYRRLSRADEIGADLAYCAAQTPPAEVLALGLTAGGRPLQALRLPAQSGAQPCLRVLLVASQHGAGEAAGGEAILQIARALIAGGLAGARESIEFVLVADANPDGRDLDSNRNANGSNLNRDFVLLSQPEARALNRLLLRFAPHVVLDLHESAVLKPRTLARTGFMTDFETQFDCANHPALPRALRDYAEHELLPRLIAGVNAAGTRAQRYLGEIVSLTQAVTHGDLSARKFRNKAGLTGALSFLLETRLDPRDGDYPSFRNIAVRVAKQVLAVTVFLRLLTVQRIAIVELLAAHAHSSEPMILSARYVSSGDGRALRIPLQAIADATLHEMAFPDHRTVAHGPSLALPRGYWITDHVAEFARFLGAHGIACSRLATARRASVVAQDFVMDAADGRPRWQQDRHIEQWLPAGTLAVPAPADRARLLGTLLEPRASSSVFRYRAYRRLLERAPEFFILRDRPL